MTQRRGDGGESSGDRKHDLYWWTVRVASVCAALSGAAIVLSHVGAFTGWAAAEGVRHEISAAADTADRWQSTRRMMFQERKERADADSAIGIKIRESDARQQANHDDTMRELTHIETLLMRRPIR